MPITILQIIGGILGPIIMLCGIVLILGALNNVDWISRFPGYQPSFRWLARFCTCIAGILLSFVGGYLAAQDFLHAVFFR